MKRICKGENGAALTMVTMVLMMLAVAVVGFQMSIMSYATRAQTKYQEDQVYLSARSTAEALAFKIADDSYNYIMELPIEMRKEMLALPDDMRTDPSITGADIISTGQKKLLDDLFLLEADKSIDLGEITLDGPISQTGTVTAKIERQDATTYIIEATAKLHADTATVKTVLTTGEYEVFYPVTDGYDGTEGNANVFYSDFGFGIGQGDGFFNDVQGVTYISKSDFYYAEGLDHTLYEIVQTNHDVVIYAQDPNDNGKFEKTNGELTSKNLTLSNTKVSNSPVSIEETLTLLDNVTIDANTQEGEYNIKCDTLIIDGKNIEIRCGVLANEIIFTENAQDIVFSTDTDYIYRANTVNIDANAVFGVNIPTFATPTGTIFIAEEEFFEGIGSNYGEENAPIRFKLFKLEKEIKLPIVETVIPDRARPYWAAVYEAGQVAVPYINGITVMKPSAQDFYVLPSTPDGKFTLHLLTSDNWEYGAKNIDITGMGDFQGGRVRIVVPDGMELTVNANNLYQSGVCFIMEGNAKIYFHNPNDAPIYRFYSDPPKQDVYDAVQQVFKQIVIDELSTNRYTKDIVANIQKQMKFEMENNFYDDVSILYMGYSGYNWGTGETMYDTSKVKGTAVVQYITSLNGHIFLKGAPYTNDDAKMSFNQIGNTLELQYMATTLIDDTDEDDKFADGWNMPTHVQLFDFVGYLR